MFHSILLIPIIFPSSSHIVKTSAVGSNGGIYVVNSSSIFLNLFKLIAPDGWYSRVSVLTEKL